MKPFELDNGMLHHDIDYTPYEGMTFNNWPRYTLLTGQVVSDRDGKGLVGNIGDGKYHKRTASSLPASNIHIQSREFSSSGKSVVGYNDDKFETEASAEH
jgi:hypothetical protein